MLEAASRLMSEQGFAGTRTADVAEDVGVSHGALFVHFPRREDLLLEVVSGLAPATDHPLVSEYPPPDWLDSFAVQKEHRGFELRRRCSTGWAEYLGVLRRVEAVAPGLLPLASQLGYVCTGCLSDQVSGCGNQ